MSKAEAHDDDEDGGGHKKTGKKKLIIIIAIVVLLVGAGVGVYLSGILAGDKKEEAATEDEHGKKDEKKDEKKEDHGKKDEKKEEDGHGGGDKKGGKDAKPGAVTAGPNGVVYYEMPSFLVNLNSGDKRTSFLKMTVTLELASAEDQLKIDEVMPRITDSFNTYLRELRSPDLAGSAGLHRLREELLLRINEISQPAKVNDILFKEIIVQ